MKKEVIDEIEKYSKAEIIAAIKALPFVGEEILSKLETNKERKIFDEASKARKKELDCWEKLTKWRKEVIEKYGDGNAVKLVDLPQEEIEKGAALEREFKESVDECRRAEKREDRLTRKYL